MPVNAPSSHLTEATKMVADAAIDLFECRLKTTPATIVYFYDGPPVVWQGKTFDQVAVRLDGDKRAAEGAEARPTLTVINPLGVFNQFAFDGVFDYATVIRYRVLKSDLNANLNVFQRRMWYVARVQQVLANQGLTLELRNMSEGANFMIPVRMFMPPEFPLVTL